MYRCEGSRQDSMQKELADELFVVIASHLPTTRSLIQFSTVCKRSYSAVKNEWLSQFKKAKDAIEVLTIQPSSKWVELKRDESSIKVMHPGECCVMQISFNAQSNAVGFAFFKTCSPFQTVMFTAHLGKDKVKISDMRPNSGGNVTRGRDLLCFIQEKALMLPAGMTLATLCIAETMPDEDKREKFSNMMRGETNWIEKPASSSNPNKRIIKRNLTPPVPSGPMFASR